jgi:TonB family protein
MKYCPTCKTRYDEEILRFCMKDGTPLLEEDEPNFIEMPSAELDENIEEDDPGEVTVIRRNPVVPLPPPTPDDDMVFEQKAAPSQRIVVPTFEEQRAQQSRAIPYQASPKTNVFKVVLLTIIGTVAVLAVGLGGLWMLQRDNANNSNVNLNGNFVNVNTNLNTNIGFDTNFNFNTNANFNTNVNTNANANVKTPTPTPKPSPSVTPTASPTATPGDDSPTPTRTPIPTPSPLVIRPGSPTPRPPSNSPINGGVLNGRATSLPTPAYPAIAKTVGASGQVTVQVSVDERGNVVSARAVSGHPLLRSAAESAARRSKISSANERLNGVLVYNFKSN